MRALLAAAATLALASPAYAVIVTPGPSAAGSNVTIVTNTADLLELDAELTANLGTETLNLVGQDADGFALNIFADFPRWSNLGVNELVLELGGDAVFTTIGTAEGAFADGTLTVDGQRAVLAFSSPEFVSAIFGRVFGSGENFVIGLTEGQTGTLTLQAVPAPTALALFGLGTLALGALRRRRG